MSLAIRSHLAPFVGPLRRCAKYFSAPRALNDYATHVPILIGLARLREIRHVLEFGCGYYSTLTFLNRTAFPHLERLQSVENDISWAETVNEVAKSDERWTLRLLNTDIAHSVRDLDVESFDLILVDDSKTSAQRAATIRAVGGRQPRHSWIVIHDFEIEEYRDAASAFKHRHRFRAYNPETGVLCNSIADWKALDRMIKCRAKMLEPERVESWVEVVRQDLQDFSG
jgi:SAM-dependent methyltransferase